MALSEAVNWLNLSVLMEISKKEEGVLASIFLEFRRLQKNCHKRNHFSPLARYGVLYFILMQNPNHYKYIIVGAGISALQAALILAENHQDFVILEASERYGGRICSLTLEEGLKDCPDSYEWLEKVKHFPIDCGATWICEDHAYMLHYVKEFGLNLTTQYYTGTHALAENKDLYHQVDKLGVYYERHKPQIVKLVKSLEHLSETYEKLSHKKQDKSISEAELKELNEFYEKYDKMTALDFIREEVKDEFLANLLGKEAATLQCCRADQFSVFELFADGGEPLANVKFYIGLQAANIDGFRLREGMSRMCEGLLAQIQKVFDQQGQGKDINALIKLNTPVTEVRNNNNPVQVVTGSNQNQEAYTCQKVITCLPAATFHKIAFQNISASKKVLVDNQIECNMTRMAMVFKQPFWRKTHAGYVSFSQNFHMNEVVELTPDGLDYGILAFVFTADGYKKWKAEIDQECVHKQGKEYELEWYEINKKRSMKIIADIYLNQDYNSPHLKEVAIFAKSLSDYPYIKSTYQSVTAVNAAYQINKLGEDKKPEEDEHNVIVLGSDFSDEFCGYMQGAIRVARKKIYALCGKEDPLASLGAVKDFRPVEH